MSKEKLIVIGLDGATFDVIYPLVSKGILPNIKKMLEEGASCILNSTLPTVTSPAWLCMVTGKNPAKIGVFGWTNFDTKTYQQYLAYPRVSRKDFFWRMLEENGFKTAILMMPLIYPPDTNASYFVSGHPGLPENKNFAYPSKLEKELRNELGELKITYNVPSEQEKVFEVAMENLKKKEKLIEYFFKKKRFDFLFLYIQETDLMQHVFWKDFDKGHSLYDPKKSEKYAKLFEEYWSAVDEFLGKIVKLGGNSATLMIVSDHGFGRVENWFYPNTWLARKGFLKMKEENIIMKKMRSHNITTFRIKKILNRFGLTGLTKLAVKNRFLLKMLKRIIPESQKYQRLDENLVDWNNTIAFANTESYNTGVIYINRKGVFSQGIVSKKDYFSIRKKIVKELSKLMGPNGENLNFQFYFREEIYNGPYFDLAPDILFTINNQEYGMNGQVNSEKLIVSAKEYDPMRSGNHRLEGILIAYGPTVKKGVLPPACVYDIAPTILSFFGVKPPRTVDGKVLKLFTKKPIFKPRDIKHNKNINEKKCFSPNDEKKVMKHLKGLGYF